MESFEHLCKVALEAEGFAVTSIAKFPVRRRTRRTEREEYQTHGYEIDLVGARGGKLVLAEVKSYFGSGGVTRQHFVGLGGALQSKQSERFKLINDPDLRLQVTKGACERFGYTPSQIEWRLYVGHFANGHEEEISGHLSRLVPPVAVIGLDETVNRLITLAKQTTYFDDAVLMTVKAMMAANRLKGERPEGAVLESNDEDEAQ